MTGEATHHVSNTLSGRLLHATGVSVTRCYQCGKCSAGCPLAVEMDYPPSRMLRMLQMEKPELDEKVVSSYTSWLCLTCETCYSRCPQEVDIPKMMDFLRAEAIKQKKVNPKAKDIYSFYQAFLHTVKRSGRLFEVGMILGYKMKTWHFMQDLLSAPGMFLSGKLSPLPHTIKGKKKFSKMFKKLSGKV